MGGEKQFKARVVIRGAKDQWIFGGNRQTLLSRATDALTQREPGIGGMAPDRVEIFEKVQCGPGIKEWRLTLTTFYEEIPQGRLKWKARKIVSRLR